MIPFSQEANGLLTLALFEREECRCIVERISDLDGWDDAAVRRTEQNGIVDTVSRDVRVARVLFLAHESSLLRQFDEKMDLVVKPLIAQFWGVDLKEDVGAQVVRYAPGGHYDTHQDAGETCNDRYFTVVCYLNDDFEGGGTHFPHLNHTAVPARGKAIVFPARYFHRAEPVIRGEKYILVSWVVGPVPIRWI